MPLSGARALGPLDVAAVKLMVARPKDLAVVGVLLRSELVARAKLVDLIVALHAPERATRLALKHLHGL